MKSISNSSSNDSKSKCRFLGFRTMKSPDNRISSMTLFGHEIIIIIHSVARVIES